MFIILYEVVRLQAEKYGMGATGTLSGFKGASFSDQVAWNVRNAIFETGNRQLHGAKLHIKIRFNRRSTIALKGKVTIIVQIDRSWVPIATLQLPDELTEKIFVYV